MNFIKLSNFAIKYSKPGPGRVSSSDRYQVKLILIPSFSENLMKRRLATVSCAISAFQIPDHPKTYRFHLIFDLLNKIPGTPVVSSLAKKWWYLFISIFGQIWIILFFLIVFPSFFLQKISFFVIFFRFLKISQIFG